MKKILFIVKKSLLQHKLSTMITILSVALAAGLVMSVFSIRDQANNAFTGGPAGFDAVLGARGSQLQLVLNTVFHLETSPGNIPWSLYESMNGNKNVELAVPYAVGDNYKGFRIVGTTKDLFTDFEYQKGKRFAFKSGGVFDPDHKEAVIGSYVAQKTGLKKGSKFNAYHGIYYNENEKHDDKYEVVGVLKPTNSPSDRVIWVPIEQFYLTEGHVLRGGGEEYDAHEHHTHHEDIPDQHKEISAVMLKLKNPASGFQLSRAINTETNDATLAWPIGTVMAELFEKIGWFNKILTFVAYIVIAVATGSILASIYNTMNERRREFAILRALGAKKGTVFSSVVSEAVTISIIGTLIGYILYAVIIGAASYIIRAQTGVVLDMFQFHPVLLITPVVMIALGALAGLIPAYKAYRTEVARNLSPLS